MQNQSLIKIQVIDEKLLIDGLHKNGINKKDEVAEYTQENTDAASLIEVIPNATTLIMSFKKINKIENLIGFNKLVKLCLDNNQIEKIANLSFLVHLKWLDLSFNEITVIEGLESLLNLEDLSLFNNKIKDVNFSLSTNINLKCLSIGNNQIDKYESVMPLRQLKNLRMLTLAGNPISKDSDYKKRIFAYFESVKFIDYLLVDTNERMQAKELYAEELHALYDEDSILQNKLAIDNGIKTRKQELDQAGILFAYSIFEDIFNSDQFINRLKHLPGMMEQISKFQEIITNITNDFSKESIDKNNVRLNDLSNFTENKNKLLLQYETETGKLSNVFEAAKVYLNDILNKKSTQKKDGINWQEWERHVSDLVNQYEKLIDELMSHELKLVENFDVLIDQYDDRLNEYKTTILDCQNMYFRALEENEKNFSTYVKNMCMDLLDRASKEDFMEDADSDKIDEEAFALLMDRDGCLRCVNSCFELHVSKILKLEDIVRNNITKSATEEIVTAKKEQHLRNRNRVLDIRNYSKSSKAQIDVLLSVEDDDDIFG